MKKLHLAEKLLFIKNSPILLRPTPLPSEFLLPSVGGGGIFFGTTHYDLLTTANQNVEIDLVINFRLERNSQSKSLTWRLHIPADQISPRTLVERLGNLVPRVFAFPLWRRRHIAKPWGRGWRRISCLAGSLPSRSHRSKQTGQTVTLISLNFIPLLWVVITPSVTSESTGR